MRFPDNLEGACGAPSLITYSVINMDKLSFSHSINIQ